MNSPVTCVDCGAIKLYARGRCNKCYLRLRRTLKASGEFEPLVVIGRPLERLLARSIRADNGCLLYTGTLNVRGYGQISVNGERMLAHRAMYELTVGPIPDGLDLDHTCHTRDLACPGGIDCMHRRCIEVAHLEPVTGAENSRRGRSFNAAKTRCGAGHPYDEANTYIYDGRRYCRACNNRHTANRKRRLRGEAA